MKKLDVIFYRNNNDKFRLGQLAQKKSKIFFEYDPNFWIKPFQLSPFKLSAEEKFHEHKDTDFGPIFGLFDDSLPDGWGLLLMDKFLKQKGFALSEISVLDRLSFLGTNTMGVLTYQPVYDNHFNDNSVFDLNTLSKQANQILSGNCNDVFPTLMRAGSSPGGARPKVVDAVDAVDKVDTVDKVDAVDAVDKVDKVDSIIF